MKTIWLTIILLVCLPLLAAENPQAVKIVVDAGKTLGPTIPMWKWFGYDEPNYTTMADGKKLLTQLASFDQHQTHSQSGHIADNAVFIRTHNLLTTGDGIGQRKWGSTNAYTETPDGTPVYNWKIVDGIIDTYIELGLKPVMEIGFMPQALSLQPEPYKHNWSAGGELWTGWAYPPKDYKKWAELVYQWVKHSLGRYGATEVQSWLWEPWNEPNIGYWQGSFKDFTTLYDYTADAVKRACPQCKIGGPHTTNPNAEKAAKFLKDFLAHCSEGINAATGAKGAPLDYIAFHAKGSPTLVDEHIRMNMSPQLEAVKKGFEIVASFEKYKNTPVLIGEFDPEGCAACSIQEHPQYAYRNGLMYPSYTAASQSRLYDLVDEYNINFLGALTWGFEFENERYFDGFRDLATNGVDKPILNLFRMFGLMPKLQRIKLTSSQGNTAAQIIAHGLHAEKSDIDGLASKSDDTIAVLIWNYHDDAILGPAQKIHLLINNVIAKNIQLTHYRIDRNHSNSFEAWKLMGSPQSPNSEQYQTLIEKGSLEAIKKSEIVQVSNNTYENYFILPRHGISLVLIKIMP